MADLNSGVGLIICKRSFVRPVDQTVVLCVDRVVVHHREKDTAQRKCAEKKNWWEFRPQRVRVRHDTRER